MRQNRHRLTRLLTWLFYLSAALVMAGCAAPKESTNNDPDKQNQPAPSNYTLSTADYEAPRYFKPQSIMSGGLLFGQAGEKLITWNPTTKETTTIVGHAWSGSISPDGQYVAYVDEDGLSLYQIENSESRMVASANNDNPAPAAFGAWSQDSKQFIYMYPMEWSSDYHIYNIENKQSTQFNFGNVSNFLSYPAQWLKDDILFVVSANKSKSGEQQYRESGYRSNLFLADHNGKLTSITDVEDDQFVLFSGASADSEKILFMLVEPEQNKKTPGIANASGGDIKWLNTEYNIASATISPDGKIVLLASVPENNQYSFLLFDLQSWSVVSSLPQSGSIAPEQYIWGTSGDVVYFSNQGDDSSTSNVRSLTIARAN